MKILGLIPARGGSKGIPNKNRKELGGKPLMQYTIEAALGAKMLSRVIFSSEDKTLIKLAEELGVEIPFIRPEQLSQDTSGSIEVVQHALHFFKELGKEFDAVCLLQVTTPFRSSQFIDNAISTFIKNGSDSLISVQKVPHHYNPHWVFEADKGTLKIATGESEIIKRRQDLPDTYIRDGAVYITKTEVLQKQNSFFGKTISYIESDPTKHVNIDTMEDWIKAEQLLKILPK
jgi:CMP-N,N'-diacetyllegionaminic acid synthase